MIQLLLARHGESLSMTLGPDDVLPGEEANGLSERGRAQVHALGRHLAECTTSPSLIASPLRRARETADILAEYLGRRGSVDPRLSERRFEFPPNTSGEASRQLQIEALLQPHQPPAYGESVADHGDRVRSWFNAFLEGVEDGESYVIVSHGGTIEHLQRCLLGAPLSATVKAFTVCGPAHYHRWVRFEPLRGHQVWRLEGVDLGPPPEQPPAR